MWLTFLQPFGDLPLPQVGIGNPPELASSHFSPLSSLPLTLDFYHLFERAKLRASKCAFYTSRNAHSPTPCIPQISVKISGVLEDLSQLSPSPTLY